MPFTIGGGVREVEDAHAVLDAGADKVSVNSAAVARPELLDEMARVFGAQCVVLAIDAKRGAGGGRSTWPAAVRRPAAAVEWARGRGRGGEILLTSMDRDGTQDGYDTALLRAVSSAVDVPVIASGGAGEPRYPVDGLRGPTRCCARRSSIRPLVIAQVKDRLAAGRHVVPRCRLIAVDA